MRWTLTLCCFALLATPALAAAQDAEAEDGFAADDAADEAAAAEGEPADEPPSTGPREATTSDPMPARTSSSVVVNEREAQLRREQEAFVEESEEGSGEEGGEEDGDDDDDSLDHEFQLGIRGGIGVPFIFALRYNNGPACDAEGDQFCLFVGSTIVTFDISFGVAPDIEIVLGGRIGAIGVEPTQTNQGQILLGLRAYISPESIAKVYLAPSLVLDLTPQGPLRVDNWGDVDFGVRGAFGVVVDPIRYLGLYVELGVNILFLRSFGISPDLSGGFQVRFP
ncbi:MAG: hypothetical protein H6719_03470 [Sandaracinaceae bacterium]|nr:hypothetical protein [Sandaracinaceae bacterium]